MATFRETCGGKMSVALQAMVDGLRRQDERDDFTVVMGFWLSVAGDRCFGCAASCAVQELCGKDYAPLNLFGAPMVDGNVPASERARLVDCDPGDLYEFEQVIDEIRFGELRTLAEYMHCLVQFDAANLGGRALFFLTDASWRENLPKVEDAIRVLKLCDL